MYCPVREASTFGVRRSSAFTVHRFAVSPAAIGMIVLVIVPGFWVSVRAKLVV
jgi:hypothetical protein